MAQPYVGEIRMFAGNFAPAGWFFCDGRLVAISEYETLFNLIGTTYGGDGQDTFALPDLRGRLPVHQGGGFVLAESAGVETVTLTTNQIPTHTHTPQASNDVATTLTPTNQALAHPNNGQVFAGFAPTVAMANNAMNAAGGSQPHNNLQPYLCVNFIISLFGIFPSPT